MNKERVNGLLRVSQDGDTAEIIFNEEVSLKFGDKIVVESYIGIQNAIITDVYIIRKETDAKEGEELSRRDSG